MWAGCCFGSGSWTGNKKITQERLKIASKDNTRKREWEENRSGSWAKIGEWKKKRENGKSVRGAKV